MAEEDALPFPLCLSATADAEHRRRYLPEVSAALGISCSRIMAGR